MSHENRRVPQVRCSAPWVLGFLSAVRAASPGFLGQQIRYNPAVKSKASKVPQPLLFELGRPEPAKPPMDRTPDPPQLLIGTSAFTAAGWPGSFYPVGMKSSDYLTYYSSRFKTVEIDSTYYGTPSESTVANWYRKTPPGFVFAAKVPQVVTHTKALLNCEGEFDEFTGRMCLLHEKLGPMLFQFPHFSKYEFNGPDEFLRRLRLFLKRAGGMSGFKFAVEIRNETWLNSRLTDLLGEYGIALALTDTSFLPRPWEFKEKFDLTTADFTYIRWLGNRKGIEKLTTTWDKIILDRHDDLTKWAELFRQFLSKQLKVYTYANNHYAGNGPATVTLFRKLLNGA